MTRFDEGWKEGGYRKHIPEIPARTMVEQVSGKYLLASYDHFWASVDPSSAPNDFMQGRLYPVVAKEYQIPGRQNDRFIHLKVVNEQSP